MFLVHQDAVDLRIFTPKIWSITSLCFEASLPKIGRVGFARCHSAGGEVEQGKDLKQNQNPLKNVATCAGKIHGGLKSQEKIVISQEIKENQGAYTLAYLYRSSDVEWMKRGALYKVGV